MSRAAPTSIPDDAPRFGDGRYVVFEAIGALAQGLLHDVWDTRLRMWRLGLACEADTRDAVQRSATVASDLRQAGLLRPREVVDDWVVLEATEAVPLQIDAPWPVEEALAAVLDVGRAALALQHAGLDPRAIGPSHLLVTESRELLLVPPASLPDTTSNMAPETATSLSLLLAGLVRGRPLENTYDDASALPPGLAAIHEVATGPRPVLAELVESLERYDPEAEAPSPAAGATDPGGMSRAEQITGGVDTDRPSYLADTEKVRVDRAARLQETRRKAEAAAEAAKAAEQAEAKANAARASAIGGCGAGIGLLLALVVMPPAGLLGYGFVAVRGAASSSQQADEALAETLELEEGARDELQALGIDPEPLRLARVAGPLHEGQALVKALEQVQRPPLSERPEAKVLAQRWGRIEPAFSDAIAARVEWKEASDGLAGMLVVGAGLAPPYEPIPSIEHLMEDPVE